MAHRKTVSNSCLYFGDQASLEHAVLLLRLPRSRFGIFTASTGVPCVRV